MSLLSLGEHLRQEREKKGITLDQVASATRINIRLLHHLESDEYEDLPAKPFVRGFVTSYSRFVGIDSDEVLTRYYDFIDQRAKDRQSLDSQRSGYAFEKKDSDATRKVLWIFIASFLTIGLISLFVIKPRIQRSRTEAIEKLRQSKAESPAKEEVAAPPVLVQGPPEADSPHDQDSKAQEKQEVALAQPVTQPTTAPAPNVEEKPDTATDPNDKDPMKKGDAYPPDSIRYKVVLKSRAGVWIRYQVDELPPQRIFLLKDKLIVFKGQNIVRFQASNMNSVLIRDSDFRYRPIKSRPALRVITGKAAELLLGDPARVKEPNPLNGLSPLQETADPEDFDEDDDV